AFVAKADDPSALFHNPAGFAQQNGWVVQVGANLVDYHVTFDRDGVYEQPLGEDLSYAGQEYAPISDESSPKIGLGPFQIVPLIGVSGDVGVKNLRIGFGLVAPQAYPERSIGADYEFEGDPDEPPPPSRYDVVKQSAATAMPSIAVAYRVHPKVDVGARFTAGIASLEATSYVWGVRNYEEWIARDGRFNVKVSDPFVPAFGLGVLARPTPAIEVGAAWSSALNVHAKGSGASRLGSDLGLSPTEPDFIEPENDFPACSAGGTDQDHLKACVNLSLPMTATLGGRYIVRDAAGGERGDVEVDAAWEQWSAASDIHVIVDGKSGLTGLPLNEAIIRHGFKDTFSIRVGGAWSFPLGKNRLVARAGAAYDTAAAPAKFQRLDIDGAARTTLTAGIAYEMPKLRIDLGGGAVLEPSRTAPTCNPDVDNPACPGDEGETDARLHGWPDPVQPLSGANNYVQNPINGGTYESGYMLLSLGVTYFI
ncbi:MAG TPA: outer membrane protein transport protein, partial [Kofleriaceae bacterium]|nr:outer membrane protein transport protein [Kofleriaceae bacterium]